MVTPHSLRQLCFGPAAAQIDPARSARSRPFWDRLIPPNQSVTEIIIVFPAFFVNTQMKIFRLLTAFSASFFLPCPQGDFSLFSLCRLLNLPRRELSFARGFAPPPPGDFAKLLAPATHYAGAPPRTRGFLRGRQSLHPPAGAPPCTRVTFPSRGKSPKARQGLRPLESPWCKVAALAALAYASRRATSSHRKRPICRFEFVGKSVFFLPELHRGSHLLLSIRGAAGGLPSRMPQAFLPTTNTARAEGQGIKGGRS